MTVPRIALARQQRAIGESVDDRRPLRGVRRVDAALRIATGEAETPLGSLSLVTFEEFRIPRPIQQKRFVVERREYFSDFFSPG